MKKILNEKGQALIEFLLFLPFMLMMYSLVLSIGNAINGSINQNKVTRSYFYYRLQNNSMAPTPRRQGGATFPSDWNTFGMAFVGWMEQFEGGQDTGKPEAPCYRLRLPLGNSSTDKCAETYSEETTQFIRVMTVFGVCGATYRNINGLAVRLPNQDMQGIMDVTQRNSCQIQ